MDFHLDNNSTEVAFCGYARHSPLNLIEQIPRNLYWIIQVFGCPDIVVLMMGSNDLVYEFSRSPTELADDLVNVCFMLYVCGVKKVLVPECLPRFEQRGFTRGGFRWLRPPFSITTLDRRMMGRSRQFNARLQFALANHQPFSFVALKGLRRDPRHMLIDGIHLSMTGMRRLRHVLRRELIVALLKCVTDEYDF